MSDTTTLTKLAKLRPESETQWRGVASRAHRLRGYPGDEAAAKTHEMAIYSIRSCDDAGTSRALRLCPRCEERGVKVALIFMGGVDRCGNCLWPGCRE